jgi:hypothetical protein
LRTIGPGVDLIAGAVEEAGVDEEDTRFDRADAFLEVDGRPPFFIHEAELDRIAAQTEHVLDRGKEVIGERHFLRAVHLRLDDVDRAGAAVARRAGPLDVMERDEAGDRGIENAFGDGVPIAVENAHVGHQVADVARQHQAAAQEHQPAPVGPGVDAVLGQTARDVPALLLKVLDKRSLAETEPIAIGRNLVERINRGDRVLEIHDGGERRLENDVGNAGVIGAADPMRAVDDDLDVEPVVGEENALRRVRGATIAAELRRLRKCDCGAIAEAGSQHSISYRIGLHAGMRAGGERHDIIQEAARPGDDLPAAFGVVAFAGGSAVSGNGVRAVERVVERPPSRVRGIERIACIADRHHELRSRHGSNFRVYIGGVDLEGRPFGDQIADLLQERPVGGRVGRTPPPASVPLVDLCLQLVPTLQQRAVQGGEAPNDSIQPLPERGSVDAGAGKGFIDDEVVQHLGNA